MRSYIEVKEARGRSKQEIAWKLELLEREVRISFVVVSVSCSHSG